MRTRFLALVCLSIAAAACSNGVSGSVKVTPVAPGASCPAGGVKIEVTGQDPQLVCNGTSGSNGVDGGTGTDGYTSLARQTTLPTGDTRCPGGGVQVDFGLDDGADGGVSRDGVLEAGEVTSSTTVCNGDDGARVGSMTPPGGAAGTDTIKLGGGVGAGGVGGTGGSLIVSIVGGTNGGHVKTFGTGHADGTFTAPATPAADFGPTPFTAVTATLTLESSATPALDAGTLFVFANQLQIAQGGTKAALPVTGLSIPAGVTLTFPNAGEGTLQVDVPRSVRNLGTLEIPGNASVTLSCGDFVGETGSSITAKGASTTDGNGQPGGVFTLQASDGVIINRGTVDVSGGSGSGNGGRGGSFTATAGDRLFNTGTIAALGGEASSGVGGPGGSVTLQGSSTFNGAAIDASAGRTTTGTGSLGGAILLGLSSNVLGETRNTAALTALGGDSACSSCAGGRGGQVSLDSSNGALISTGIIVVKGGAADLGGNGGNAFLTSHQSSLQQSSTGVAGSVWVSGSIDASGGPGFNGGPGIAAPGTHGGNGGVVSIEIQNQSLSGGGGGEVVLLGYAGFDASGGNGLWGGGGGSLRFTQSDGESNLVGGAVINTVRLSATGGTGNAASPFNGAAPGGQGGSVQFSTHGGTSKWQTSFELVANTAAIDLSGGAGLSGGTGGSLSGYGRDGFTSSGAVTLHAGSSTTGAGAQGGQASLSSGLGTLALSGAFDLRGGASTGAVGGEGGSAYFDAALVHSSATIDASGGATTAAFSGGAGGVIELVSALGPTENLATAPAGFSVAGGAGTPAGDYGYVNVDGARVTSAWTH